MEVIGVVDLRDGQAVHARGGVRQRYAPVRLSSRDDACGDPIALARFYVDELGIRELYVADLDAIERRPQQHALVDRLLSLGVPIWLDAGIAGARQAVDIAARGVSHVVVGLETLPSPIMLGECVAAVPTGAVAFSLDLRDGRPLTQSGGWYDGPEAIAAQAAGAGVTAVIVLDLARVGAGSGMEVEMLSRIGRGIPGVSLLAGGGVASSDDLRAAADAGCDGVLAASALLDGRLTTADIRHARSRR